MTDNRPKDFWDLFSEKKVYDHVSDRKDRLVEEFLSPSEPKLPLVRIYSQRPSTDKVLNHLKKWADTDEAITNFSSDLPYAAFKQRNGSLVSCDYICVEYFRLHMIASGKNQIKRYTYFEIYYDDIILTCLMDIPTFQTTGGMACLEMNAKSWAYAKMQMKIWNRAIHPDIEELDQDSALIQRIENYHELTKGEGTKIYSAASAFGQTANMDRLWPALAYLCLFQISELLPPKYIPHYAINFVCSNESICRNLEDKLSAILSVLFQDDCYIKGNIPIHSDYQQLSNKDVTLGLARPYIFHVQRNSSAKDLIKDLNRFSRLHNSKKKWSKHPFLNDTPICVSTKELTDSVILNIKLPDQAVENISVSCFPEQLLAPFFLTLRKEKKKNPKYCKKRQMAKRLLNIHKAITSNFSSKDDLNCIKRHQQLLRQSIVLFLIHDIRFRKKEMPDDVKEWFAKLLSEWKAQDATLLSVMEQVLIMVQDDYAKVRPGYPNNEDDFLTTYRGMCVKDDLFLYHQQTFKELITEQYPSVQYSQIMDKLAAGKYIRTNQKNQTNRANKKDLRYAVKLSRKTVQTVAFFIEKLQ